MIAGDFYNDWLDNSSRGLEPVKPWLLIPVVGAAHRVRELGALEQAVRRFLTLVCAVDYRLNSDRLWGAAAQLYSTGPELFNPAVVAAMLPEQLHRDLYAGGVAGRFHQRNAKSWQRVTERLVSRDGSAVRRVIDEGIGCVDALRKDLKHFPSCVGKKSGRCGSGSWRILVGPKLRRSKPRRSAWTSTGTISRRTVEALKTDRDTMFWDRELTGFRSAGPSLGGGRSMWRRRAPAERRRSG